MVAFLHDLRHAFRGLSRSRSFTAITILTLGLGIGAVTALFAVTDAVVLHPVVPEQDRVVRVWLKNIARRGERVPFAYPEFRDLRDQARSFEALSAINFADAIPVALTTEGQTSAVAVAPVSAEFFAAVRSPQPLHGRWFDAADERPGTNLVAVVSERFWRRVAAGDPAFVGRRLTRAGGGRTLVVIGIAPREFDYPLGTDIWVPITRFFGGGGLGAADFNSDTRQTENRGFFHFELVGRLASGVSREQARAEISALQGHLATRRQWDAHQMEVVVEPVLDSVLGNSRQILWFLLAASGLVFAIAGVNVAALLMMRAAARQTEIAVRVALGASRSQLARQALAESLALGALGVIVAFAVARLCLGLLRWLAPADVPRIGLAEIDLRVLGFCVAAALSWVLALGTVPVWNRPAHTSFRGVSSARGLRMFAVAEIAAAVVIAISASLLVRSFIHLHGVDRGFGSNDLAVVSLMLPEQRYPNARARRQFFSDLLARVESLPGVAAAGTVHMAPGSGSVGLSAPMIFEGQTTELAKTNPLATWEPITPSHFRAMRIPIVRGREFTDDDDRNGAPVAIVSEEVARRYWPGQEPIGKRLQFVSGSDFPWATVVGVAADLRYRELTKSWMTVYFPADQFFFFQPKLVVRAAGSDPVALTPAIRQTVRGLDADVAIDWIEPMDALLAKELARPRTALGVTFLFAVIATLLAAVGVYGVMSYEVRERRRELAVRAAIGAGPARLFKTVLARGGALGAAGAAVGLAVSAVTTRSVQALLFEVDPVDPAAFAAGACTLLGIVLIACLVPARRAAHADPAAVLRTE